VTINNHVTLFTQWDSGPSTIDCIDLHSSSEPSPSPGEEEEGSSGKVLPMGVVGATPAQVSRALKVHNGLYVDGIIQ